MFPVTDIILAFNLIEICCLILPFEWWMPRDRYERLNNIVMGIIYSPLLLITAYMEKKRAFAVKYNRRHHEQDDDTTEEWEYLKGDMDFEAEGWTKVVDRTKPNVETDVAVLEIRELKEQVGELTKMLEALKGGTNGSS